MRLLGAVLAGGASSRFGSDKAFAIWRGKALIEHVIDQLRPQVDALVVVGRDGGISDRPAAGLGPLGGLCAALHHAATNGFDQVVTSGCDLPELPDDLAQRLGTGPAYVTGQPLLALWPASLAVDLDAHLAAGGSRSLYRWIEACGARAVDLGPVLNVNRPEDLP